MKILEIEAVSMGSFQQEIADKVFEYVAEIKFNSVDDFDMSKYIAQACRDLGWHSVPDQGGLVVHWDDK